MKKTSIARCAAAVSLFRGLYARVAHKMGVDVSYVSRIARGERKSKIGAEALTKEFNRVVAIMRIRTGPRCKISQKVHVAAQTGAQRGGERIPCLNCDNRFGVAIPDRIVDGPFPG